MPANIRTIGVANGGRDCAGLNAVEEAVGADKAVDPSGDDVRAARAVGIGRGDRL